MLFGRKFNEEFFWSVFLSKGVTEATFAFLGNGPSFILLLFDCVGGPSNVQKVKFF